MATTERNHAMSPGERSGSVACDSLGDQRRVRTTARLLIGAGAAMGIAPLLPWVRYAGLIQTEARPGAASSVIGAAFATLLIITGVRTSRSACSTRLAVAAAGASILSALTSVVVAMETSSQSTALEEAQPGLGVFVLLAGGVAGIVGLVRSYRGRS